MFLFTDTPFMQLTIEDILLLLKKFSYGYPLKLVVNHFFSILEKLDPSTSENSVYQKCYSIIASNPEYIETYKMDGLLFLRPSMEGLDLIKHYAKFKLIYPNEIDMPKNASFLRKKSILTLKNLSVYDENSRINIKTNFSEYLEDIQNKYITFYRYYPKLLPAPTLIIKYKTRFNDMARKLNSLNKFDFACSVASAENRKAVFLTLTTDPKRFKSLWAANRNFSIAWNKFMSFLTKKFGTRPKYIMSFEYTKKTGLLHCHVIFFGRSYLLSHRYITEEWKKCGQGEINYLYGIHNSMGRWLWNSKKPQNAGKHDAIWYLKKYLNKAIFSNEDLELYWTFNKRFFSCSRRYLALKLPKLPRVILWKFCGTYQQNEIPDIIYLYSNIVNYFLEGEPH